MPLPAHGVVEEGGLTLSRSLLRGAKPSDGVALSGATVGSGNHPSLAQRRDPVRPETEHLA